MQNHDNPLKIHLSAPGGLLDLLCDPDWLARAKQASTLPGNSVEAPALPTTESAYRAELGKLRAPAPQTISWDQLAPDPGKAFMDSIGLGNPTPQAPAAAPVVAAAPPQAATPPQTAPPQTWDEVPAAAPSQPAAAPPTQAPAMDPASGAPIQQAWEAVKPPRAVPAGDAAIAAHNRAVEGFHAPAQTATSEDMDRTFADRNAMLDAVNLQLDTSRLRSLDITNPTAAALERARIKAQYGFSPETDTMRARYALAPTTAATLRADRQRAGGLVSRAVGALPVPRAAPLRKGRPWH